jgi:nucleoside-diphosphate-sugar epimerase
MNTNAWSEYILTNSPDVLILNDWWGVGNEHRNDKRQLENVERLVGLTESALNAKVETIIGIGSQAELGPVESEITEMMPDNPTTIYGRAKVETRLRMQDLISKSDSRFIWMRVFSIYGPLDEGSWLIPNVIDSLLNEKRLEMTRGEQEWSYLHAYDLASSFSAVINDPGTSGVVNVGNPTTISIREVGLTIANLLKKTELLDIGALEYRPDQVMKLKPLCETLTRLGWRPQITFQKGIEQTIDWLSKKELISILTENKKTIHFDLPARP